MQAPGSNISICPTFNPRSNGNLSEIGAKVAQDHGIILPTDRPADSDFAFATRSSNPSSPIPADEIFQNGKIRPLYLIPSNPNPNPTPNYTANNVVLNLDSPPLPIPDVVPIGNRKLSDPSCDAPMPKSRNPLRKLFGEERRNVPRTTSSGTETDDLAGLPRESYCALRSKDAAAGEEEEARPKKNALATAAGNFQRKLKIIGLLNRAIPGRGNRGNSVFLTHSNSEKKENEKKPKETPPISRKSKSGAWDGVEKQQA